VSVQETKDEQNQHASHVRAPGRYDAFAGITRQHDDADAQQHGEDRDELPIGEESGDEPHPPVEATEVAVGRRVPAGQTREREELDVNGQHAEDAYAPQHIERPDASGPFGLHGR
jgi:hypothetical protein